jgi:glycosyltransferase involved in cell wall biosynthesis
MSRPLVSVIVPLYNHEGFVERALGSVVAQDYRPLELIVIDDGSRDGSRDLAKAFLDRHMPSAVLLGRENRGASVTLNEGIGLSRGDYVTFLNSDDEFAPGRIAAFVDTATRSGGGFIYSGVSFIDSAGEPVADDYIEQLEAAQSWSDTCPTLGFALMRHQLAISTGNFFLSRDLVTRVGGFRSYRYVHDWDFILRSLAHEEPVRLPDRLYRYRLHGHNSFKALADVAGYETSEVMRNFLWSMTCRMPENFRAPCPFYWPGIFETLMEEWNYWVYLPPRWRHAHALRTLLR